MALKQRVESLRKRHREIEWILKDEGSRPSPDTTLVRQLKREKLVLKDAIEQLLSTQRVAA